MNSESQLQSEALIRLLIAARYQDAKLSLTESDAIQRHIDALPWESGTAKSVFVMSETARVREALSTEGARQKFLEEQCAQLKSEDAKYFALKTLGDVMNSDGVDPRENKFLAHVEALLKK